METQPNGGQNKPPTRTPEQEFAARVSGTANRQLGAILGTEAGKRAAHTITMAMLSAMRTSRDPSAFLKVTEASVADCVATSYDTGLNPGGPNPSVYLVPQAPRKGAQPELQWRITHRGLAILASRAGFGILAVPVAKTDHLKVAFGEAIEHEADPAAWPQRLGDLQGCILVVRRISDGQVIARPWMPLAAIAKRKDVGRGGDVWSDWPIEQAQKTVIKWGFARGYVPVDSPELQSAMTADGKDDYIDTTAVSLGTEGAMSGKGALGLGPKALPDHGEPEPSFREQADRLNQRERVVIDEEEAQRLANEEAARRDAAAAQDEGPPA